MPGQSVDSDLLRERDDGRAAGRTDEVRWAPIDRALGRFTAASVLPLLSAAIDSPLLDVVRPQLWLVWTRALRRPPTGEHAAGPADLGGLVAAGLAADPRPPLQAHRAVDPRTLVRYLCGNARFRVHPGELEHPLLFLRSLSMVAEAIDPYLISRIGFGLNDALELALRAGDRYLCHLSPAWPVSEPPALSTGEDLRVESILTEAEVSAAAGGLQAVSISDLADSCTNPGQAALALQWPSRAPLDLRATIGPAGLSLGPVLVVTADPESVPVPAALILNRKPAVGCRFGHPLGLARPQRTWPEPLAPRFWSAS